MQLKKNDLIDIIAPGSIGQKDHFKKALGVLRDRGFKTRFPEDMYGPTKMVSNTDERRFDHLQKALLNTESKAIWCVRGGYGSIRLLPHLAKLKKPRHKKIFIGYSDVTSLHLFLNQNWGWPTIHGPLLDRVGKGVMTPIENKSLWNLIEGEPGPVRFSDLKTLLPMSKSITGKIIGGNLMVAQSTLGTPFQIDGSNRILFFEEIDERPYRIDRILHHMEQAQVFKKAKAILFGQIVGIPTEEIAILKNDVLLPFAKRMKCPVITGLSVGHGTKQLSLPLNQQATLVCNGEKAQLTL